MELDREELSTKFDEANQTIGALRFENNFLAERTSSTKLDKMLSIQKSASDRTGLGYGLSSSNTAFTSTTVFVPPTRNTETENTNVKISLASENLDKGKSILGAPSKLDKKDVKNPKAKKANSQKLK